MAIGRCWVCGIGSRTALLLSDAMLLLTKERSGLYPRSARVKGVQGGSETSNVVRVGDGGTDEKTGGRDGGGIIEDVTICIRSDKN